MAKLTEVEGHSGQDYAEKHQEVFGALKQRILELEAALKNATALSDSQVARLKDLEAEHSSRGAEKDRLEGVIARMDTEYKHKIESLQKELDVTLAKLKVTIHPYTYVYIHMTIFFSLLYS